MANVAVTEALKSITPEDKAAAFNLIGNTQMYIGGVIVFIIMLIAFGTGPTILLLLVGFAGYLYLKTRPGTMDNLQAYDKKFNSGIVLQTATPQ